MYEIIGKQTKTKSSIFSSTFGNETLANNIIMSNFFNIYTHVDITDDNQNTPLIYATKKGWLNTVKLLIEKGANVNHINTKERNALIYAIKHNLYDIAKLLIENGVNVNCINIVTPLMFAALKENYAMVMLLLDAKVDVNYIHAKTNALEYALKSGNIMIIKTLLDNGAKMGNAVTYLVSYCYNNLEEIVRFLLKYNTTPNVDDVLDALRHVSWYSKRFENNILLMLLEYAKENNCNLNAKNLDGYTALSRSVHRSRSSSSLETTLLLIKYGSDVNSLDNEENNVLYHCLTGNHDIEMCRILLCNGADVNKKNKNGITPFMVACINGYKEICKLFLTVGVNTSDSAYDDKTTLTLTHQKLYSFMMKRVNLQDINGYYELFSATKENKIDLCKLLLEHGTDINYGKGVLEPIFTRAVLNSNEELCKLFISYGANVNIQCIYGYTPIMKVVHNNKMCKFLINNGANLYITDNFDRTILSYACLHEGNLNMKELLENADFDIYINNQHILKYITINNYIGDYQYEMKRRMVMEKKKTAIFCNILQHIQKQDAAVRFKPGNMGHLIAMYELDPEKKNKNKIMEYLSATEENIMNKIKEYLKD